MKTVVMYVVFFGVLAFFIHGRSKSPDPPQTLAPIELLHPDYGWHWPEDSPVNDLSYWFYERTEHSTESVLAIEFAPRASLVHHRDMKLFWLAATTSQMKQNL
jgi:hypothetical protein